MSDEIQKSFERSEMLRNKKMEMFQEDINKMCKQLSESGIKEKYLELNSDFYNSFKNFCLWYTQPDKSETVQYKQPYSSHIEGNKHTIEYSGIKFIFI